MPNHGVTETLRKAIKKTPWLCVSMVQNGLGGLLGLIVDPQYVALRKCLKTLQDVSSTSALSNECERPYRTNVRDLTERM